MSIRKTQRKNKTKQIIIWPSNDDYFTVKSLVALNPHMLTSAPKPSDITLRVRLNRAIYEEGLVGVIGHKNCGKGRPELVFAMKPVKQTAIDKAKTDNIMIDTPRLVTVMDISSQPKVNITPVTVTVKQAVNA
jgi:hypothetical protein